jgi:hypothetical protein
LSHDLWAAEVKLQETAAVIERATNNSAHAECIDPSLVPLLVSDTRAHIMMETDGNR